jgi:hypothetical protein
MQAVLPAAWLIDHCSKPDGGAAFRMSNTGFVHRTMLVACPHSAEDAGILGREDTHDHIDQHSCWVRQHGRHPFCGAKGLPPSSRAATTAEVTGSRPDLIICSGADWQVRCPRPCLGKADRINAEAGFLSDLTGDALGRSPANLGPLCFKLDNLSGLNLAPPFQQLGIPPDMLIRRFLGQVAAMQVLGSRVRGGRKAITRTQ